MLVWFLLPRPLTLYPEGTEPAHIPLTYTLLAIITADRASRAFESSRHPEEQYRDQAARQQDEAAKQKPVFQRFLAWGKENRYPIVGASWVASMGLAFAIVGRNPYLTTSQKIVQARVYAQGLTLAVLIATAAFEIGDRENSDGMWETVKVVDPNDPEHKHLIEKRIHHESYQGEDLWKGWFNLIMQLPSRLFLISIQYGVRLLIHKFCCADMVEAEERRIKEREQEIKEQEERDAKAGKHKHKKHDHHETQKEKNPANNSEAESQGKKQG